MKRCKSSGRKTTVAALSAAVIVAAGGVFAQGVDDVLQANQRRIDLA